MSEHTRVIGQPIRKDVPFIPNVGIPTYPAKAKPVETPKQHPK